MNSDENVILVTGATGQIGKRVVNELKKPEVQNLRVIAAVRTQEKAASLKTQGVETVLMDLDKPETIEPALQGVDSLFLVASYTLAMLPQAKAVIDSAKKAGVSHIVHLGAWYKYDTTIPHHAWHQYIESYIEWSGFAFTHLHPNWFMQNIFSKTGTQQGGTIYQCIGDARVSWINADDVALAAAVVLRSPADHAGKVYPLAVESRSVGEIAELLTEEIGMPFTYAPQPPDVILPMAIADGMEPEYAKSLFGLFEKTANGMATDAADVFDNFEALTGKPPRTWRDFVRKHKDMFRYQEAVTANG